MRVVGLDGYQEHWLAVVLRDGTFEGAKVCDSLVDAVGTLGDVMTFAVDIPIGLSERGSRVADVEARRFVGPRASSVFPAPIQAAVRAATYKEALKVSREIAGKGLPSQSYALRSKILEADQLAHSDKRVFEIHPEVSFRELAQRPLPHGKHTWAGSILRRRLLAEAGIILPDDLGPAGSAPTDDVLDAAVAAWSAHRIATGRAHRLPMSPGSPVEPRLMTIWY